MTEEAPLQLWPRSAGGAEGRTRVLEDPVMPTERGASHCVLLGPSAATLPLSTLRQFVRVAVQLLRPGGTLRYRAAHPDHPQFAGCWPGGCTAHGSFHRPLRQHVELLRLFPLRMRLPVDPTGQGQEIEVVAERLPEGSNATKAEDARARYGPASSWRRFDRLEEPECLDDLLFGLQQLRVPPNGSVIALGMNDGRELEGFRMLGRRDVVLHGVDHAPEAVAEARARFPEHAARFQVVDLDDGEALGRYQPGPVDAVIALNVLQCTTIDRDRLLQWMDAQSHGGTATLLSIPDCHQGPEDILRRPLDRADARHDRSLVSKDLRHLARVYYRRGARRVVQFGTYDRFLLAYPKA